MEDRIKKLITISGQLLNSEIIKKLREKGWTVSISPYYYDSFQNKAREIDIVAEKEIDIIDNFYNWKGTVNTYLYIECKYLTSPHVFWFDKINETESKELVKNTISVNHHNNIQIASHHYTKHDNVAKIFASEKSSAENEPIYKALNQCLNATIYFRNSRKSLIPRQLYEKQKIIKKIHYPVIVVDSFKETYETKINNTDPSIFSKKDSNFILEVNYTYPNKDNSNIKEYFLVDIISKDTIENYLVEIDNDIKLVKNLLD